MESKYFYCYSSKLMKYFCENGLQSITTAIHEKTQKRFWIFESSDKVSELLTKWRANRPS